MAIKKQFEIVVRGQYHSLHEASGTPTLKNYTAKFILPTQEAALSTVCRHLLAPYLRKHYPDFIRFRTHELVSITLVGYKPNPEVLQMAIDEMTLPQLFDFCVLKEILIDPYKHYKSPGDLPALRDKITEAWRAKRQNIKDLEESKDAFSQKEADELLELNELPPASGTDGPGINVNEQIASRNANTKSSDTNPATGTETLESDESLPPIIDDEPAIE